MVRHLQPGQPHPSREDAVAAEVEEVVASDLPTSSTRRDGSQLGSVSAGSAGTGATAPLAAVRFSPAVAVVGLPHTPRFVVAVELRTRLKSGERIGNESMRLRMAGPPAPTAGPPPYNVTHHAYRNGLGRVVKQVHLGRSGARIGPVQNAPFGLRADHLDLAQSAGPT